jgi:gamma-glutamyltranspeptidase / glutathione hydrolase
MRRAFADRNEYIGDPDFVEPPARLLLPAYAAERRATIDPERATPSASVRPGLGEPQHTTHFAVVDGAGMVVALTTTINDSFGSGVTVKGAGFLLNNEMDDFTAKVGAPNMFGLVQGKANAIAPGKRPLSAMSPTIVVAPEGRVRMVVGARGGPRIITATFQVISNVLDFELPTAAAVSAPRVHHQHLPDQLLHESGGLSGEVIRELEARGHKLSLRAGSAILANAPAIVRQGDVWEGLADPRRGGLAAGL